MAVVTILEERGRLGLSVRGKSIWAGVQHEPSRVYDLHAVNTPAVQPHGSFFCGGRVWADRLHYVAADIDSVRIHQRGPEH